MAKKYYYELNFIRGIACFMVVMVHVTARHYNLNDQYFNWFTLFLNQVSRFGTPLFAIIAGFLLFNQSFRGRFNLKRFFKSRFTKIIAPFVVWSFIYLYIRNYAFPWIDGGKSIEEFLIYFLLGDSQYHLYFIVLVIQFYILFLILQFIKNGNTLIFLTVLSFFVNYFFIIEKFDFGNELVNTFLHDRSSILNWIFYFILGGLFAYYWKSIVNWIKNNPRLITSLAIVVVVFSVYEYMTFGMYSSTRVTNLMFIPIIFLFFTNVYYSLNDSNKMKNFFVRIGNLSMGIYLVHPFVLYLLKDYPIIFDQTRYILLAYVLVLLLSILLVKIIQKLPLSSYVVTVAAPRKAAISTEDKKQDRKQAV